MTGAGAAALTAAAVFMAPAAAAAPADDAGEAARSVQEQAEQAVNEAEQALERARQQAREAAEQGGNLAEDQAQDVFGSMPEANMGDWLPDDLRQDLQSLQDLPASERAQELQDIVRSALSGDYGDEVERWTERIGGLISSLPQDLRQDIQGVFGQEPEEARADIRQIMEGAVDGEYGEDVEKWADRLRETAQRWDLSRAVQGARMDMPGGMMDGMQGNIMDRIPDDVLQRIPSDVREEMQNRLQSNN